MRDLFFTHFVVHTMPCNSLRMRTLTKPHKQIIIDEYLKYFSKEEKTA